MPIPNFLTGHPQLCETLGTDPAKGLFFNGFVGPVPTVARNYGSALSNCPHTVIRCTITRIRAHIAHFKGRGTRTAETDMCN